ncbi:hypothetical protein Tco_0093510 [Tanacetum coccineum]
MNGPYVRRMIPEPGDADREVPVNETFHEQTDDELTEKELKRVEADDPAILTILLGLLEDIYATVDSCETAQEIWLRVQQMMKGSDIRIQEKKAKLFNEWERFTSTDGESVKSYYHHFSKLMNDFKRNKHFPEKIAIQNQGVQNVGNQNGLIVVSGIANQNPNGNGNVGSSIGLRSNTDWDNMTKNTAKKLMNALTKHKALELEIESSLEKQLSVRIL